MWTERFRSRSIVAGFVLDLAARMGVTRAVAYGVLVRSWSVVAGPVTLICVGHFLSPDEQGFYYTFWSVLGLQLVFELGFSFVIAQFASHERAGLQRVDGRMIGDPRARARLASLLRLSVTWYFAAGLFMIVVLLPGGGLFFMHYGRGSAVNWVIPWILVTITTACNLMLIPFAALLEGSGQVDDVNAMRLLQLMTANLLVWLSLATGFRLYSAVMLSATMATFAALWMVVRHRTMFVDLWREQGGEHQIHWRSEVWPFQWRMAVSWIGGYIIFQLFTPILFATQGAAAAARMGMSLMVVIALSSLAVAWLNARAVDFGALIASRRFEELDLIFRRTLWQSSALMAFIAAGFLGAVIVLRAIHHPFADRLLPPLPLVLLIAGTIANHIFVAEATYLRAFKREPFMVLTLTIAFLAVGGSLLAARSYGAVGIASVFFGVMLIIGVGGGTAIFLKARVRWRDQLVESTQEVPLTDSRSLGDSLT